MRSGVTEVSVTKNSALSGPGWLARLAPLTLPQSKQMRLARLYKGAVYKESGGPDGAPQLQLPVTGGAGVAGELAEALAQLVPEPSPAT